LGTLFLNHVRQPYVFSEEDVATTTAMAGQAAVAIDNARLYRDARRLAAQLRASFGYAGEALASVHDVQRTLHMMVQLAAETVSATGGSIALLEETGRSTYLVASSGPPPPDDLAEGESAQFPLATAERPLGVLTLWRRRLPFTEDERDLLASFAGHVRTAVEHARLYTSLQEERERARQAERAQAEFTSMISHELRTPLALIKGYVSTLLKPTLALPPETSHRFLEGIDQACERLRKLIDNLLSATALDAGLAFPSQPEPIDLAALLQKAIAGVSVLAAGRRFSLSARIGRDLVLGDSDQLSQLFENLLYNALKYAPGETPIEVRVERSDTRVLASVRDYGPGIPASALHLVFEKFYRVPSRDLVAEQEVASQARNQEGQREGAASRASSRPGGMGLGLYICRKIAEAHGGQIWAENVPEGGAAFFVALPAVRQAPDRRSEERIGGRIGNDGELEGRKEEAASSTVRGN
jgi:signal transduction histidine kinase